MRGRAGVLGALLALAAAGVMAQEVDMAVPPAARCLTVAAGQDEAPTYPFDEFKRDVRGTVKVLLEFKRADQPPRVTVQESTSQPFADAVLAHAQALRVPCLAADSPGVRLIREYVFRPDSRRAHWFRSTDADDEDNRVAWTCVRQVRGRQTPRYPQAVLAAGVQGRVVAEARFEGPDTPPVVRVHARPGPGRQLADSVADWLRDSRMPCHPGRPVTAWITFLFLLEGEPAFGFKEVTFRNLLAATARNERQTLALDTTTMGCPFDVELWYRQPHAPNRVAELGERNATRRPLLEWLETVEFKLPPPVLDTVFGDRAVITVPCIRVDLKPKE